MLKSAPNKISLSDVVSLCLLLAGAVVAFIYMSWTIQVDPGVTADSVVYINTAKSLLNGDGFYTPKGPLVHYPPGYPTFLAFVGLYSNSIMGGLKVVIPVILALNTLLFCILIYKGTNKNIVFGICAFVLFLTSRDVVLIHSMVWSEPIFLFFLFMIALSFAYYIATNSIYGKYISLLSLCWCIQVRYVGLALIPPILIMILVFQQKSLVARIKELALYAVVGGVPFFVWAIRNKIVSNSATNRVAGVHIISKEKINNAVSVIYDFFSAFSTEFVWKLLFVILFVALVAITLSVQKRRYGENKKNECSSMLLYFFVLFAVSYTVLLLISISFFDAHTPMDSRILLPVTVAMAIILFLSIFTLFFEAGKIAVAYAVVLLIAFFSISGVSKTLDISNHFSRVGIGYSSLPWKQSPAIKLIEKLSPNVKLYTNGPDVIRFYSSANATFIPRKVDPLTHNANPMFSSEMERMCADLHGDNSALVFFHRIRHRWYLPDLETIYSICQLETGQHLGGAVVVNIDAL